MRVLNYGSLNIDETYRVPHIVRPGETITAHSMDVFVGGKGLNQSVALAQAGLEVWHAGKIGEDGTFLTEFLNHFGVDTSLVARMEGKNGRAVIQVDDDGQNCIFLYSGSNRALTKEEIDHALLQFGAGDILVLQNEVNLLPYLLSSAKDRGMVTVLNPSPYDALVEACDLSLVDLFLVNETEGQAISGEREPEQILAAMAQQFPGSEVVLTLGKAGAMYSNGVQLAKHGIFDVPVVDTTAAGDTFTGYFLEGWCRKLPPEECLRRASMASALAIGKQGAAPSIPDRAAVEKALQQEGF